MTASAGERFASALLAKDWDGVTTVLDSAIYHADADKITKLKILCSGFLRSGM
jgi:hypothetical protein